MVKSENKSLYNILKHNDNQLYIPIFQRQIKWPKKTRMKFYNDVMRKNKNRNIDFSAVYVNHLEKEDKTQIVDGQQRMTHYSILTAATCAYCKHNGIKNNWEELLYYSVLINRIYSEDDEKRIKIKLKNKDNNYYKELILNLPHGKDVKSKISIVNQAYADAYSFVSFYSEKLDVLIENLREVRATECVLEKTDDPQECFMNANDEGESLTLPERLCSILIFKSADTEQEQETIFYQYWHNISDYFGNANKKFEDFLNAVSQIQERNYQTAMITHAKEHILNSTDAINLLRDLNDYFGIYKKITNANTGIIDIDNSLNFMSNARTNSFVLSSLFMIFKQFNEDIISKECFVNCIKLLETHIMRCWILNKDSSGCIRYVFKLKEFEDTSVSLDYYLFSKIESEGYFISDKEFAEKLKHYKFKTNNGPKPVLLRIINFDNPEEKFTLLNTSTEHIMVQKLTKEWIDDLGFNYKDIHEKYLNTICNLTLLPKGHNSALSNLGFVKKLKHEKGYLNSKIPLNQQLGEYSIFNENALEHRGDFLVDIALKIWCYPSSIAYGENTIQSTLMEGK